MLTLLLAVFMVFVSTGSAYQCYICSWSPRDVNRTDNCTDKNFDPHNVPSDTCELGCETFVQYNKNVELDQWRRNCLQKGTNLTGDCIREDNKAVSRMRCTCAVDYCNAAAATTWTCQGRLILFLALVATNAVRWA